MSISDEKALELAQDILDETRRCSDCDAPANDQHDLEAMGETGLCKVCLDTYLFGDD